MGGSDLTKEPLSDYDPSLRASAFASPTLEPSQLMGNVQDNVPDNVPWRGSPGEVSLSQPVSKPHPSTRGGKCVKYPPVYNPDFWWKAWLYDHGEGGVSDVNPCPSGSYL